ncbi:MAG: hypothetical protein QG567_995 [Campylobacterota bacterium]|nr:hypothetical protein [Campylobacterota bacterium]
MKLYFFIFNLLVLTLFSNEIFDQNFPNGGFLKGAYDTKAISPTPYNTTRTSKYKTDIKNPKTEWVFSTNGYEILTAPAIDRNGVIYFGANDKNLYALNSNGGLRWKFKTKGAILSSPIIRDDEIVIFGSKDGNLYALDKNGSLKWKYDTSNAISATPALDDAGNVYFGTHNGFFYALDRGGKLRWKLNLKAPIKSGCSIDSLGTIYTGSEKGVLFAITKDGKVAWSFKTGVSIKSSPVVDSNNTIFITSSDWHLYALDTKGALKWKYKTFWFVTATPALSFDSSLYFGSWDWAMHAISSTDGDLKWSNRLKPYSASYIAASALVDANHTVFVGARSSGYVYAFDKNGNEIWKIKLNGDMLSAPTLNRDGGLLVPTDEGYIYLIK